MTELSLRLVVSVAQILAEMGIVVVTVATMTYFERKVLGWMQDRMGPMEVGPYGILQPVADGIKLFFKEDITPAGANKAMFALAPMLTMVVAMIGFAVIPFGPNITMDIFGITIKPFVVADIAGITLAWDWHPQLFTETSQRCQRKILPPLPQFNTSA